MHPIAVSDLSARPPAQREEHDASLALDPRQDRRRICPVLALVRRRWALSLPHGRQPSPDTLHSHSSWRAAGQRRPNQLGSGPTRSWQLRAFTLTACIAHAARRPSPTAPSTHVTSGMLSSTSPTLSTPPSPVFHLRRSPYHAPRRPSTSSCASPRPSSQLTNPPPRRPDAHHNHHQPAAPHHSPVPAFARSPHPGRRRYCDSSTQYSPDGYPPTYRPAPSQPQPPATSLTSKHPPSNVPVARGDTSATTTTVTEPPEPSPRTSPQTALPTKPTQPNTRPSTDPNSDQEPQPILHTPRQHDDAAQAAMSSDQSSPAKRARPQSSSLKVMPFKYETCDVKELGILVSDMLMELVRLNDDMPLRDGQLTRFHSR